MGRQPWIVFGLQKTVNAVSPAVSAGEVLFSLIMFTLLYGALMAADVYLMAKFARAGLNEVSSEAEHAEAASPATVGA
jgi:cytochrome d ubiquinol oxidase subunit I